LLALLAGGSFRRCQSGAWQLVGASAGAGNQAQHPLPLHYQAVGQGSARVPPGSLMWGKAPRPGGALARILIVSRKRIKRLRVPTWRGPMWGRNRRHPRGGHLKLANPHNGFFDSEREWTQGPRYRHRDPRHPSAGVPHLPAQVRVPGARETAWWLSASTARHSRLSTADSPAYLSGGLPLQYATVQCTERTPQERSAARCCQVAVKSPPVALIEKTRQPK
jgi:hypothetical protein